MTVTAHCVVKNEDIWLWYAIQSVLPFVDQFLIYDTGSTDKTVEVIKTINSPKVIFEEKGQVNKQELVRLRQEQLERTTTDWFLILDGDEIWSKKQIATILKVAETSPKNIVAIFNRVRNLIGDVYHYLPEDQGNYQIAGIKGNLNIRLIRKTEDLRIKGEYPLEAYTNQDGLVQNQDKNLIFADLWYLHTSFLKRSSSDRNKVSGSFGKNKLWQIGLKMKNSELPEVFKKPHPNIVPDPFKKRSEVYETGASILDPFLKLRKFLK